ncbi:MAG: class IV adenylate cyclase [Acidobacteriota bacterium]
MIEREVKVRVEDLDAVRSRLIEAGAELLEPKSRESNTLFDREGELRGHGCVLRVRRDGQGAKVTFKGPAVYEQQVKSRTELETSVGDADRLEEILVALGLRATLRYEKDREQWRFDGAVVALDHTPLGDFVEVEAERPLEHLEGLGLADAEPERLSYVGLWLEARAANPALGVDMVFPPSAREDPTERL